MCTEKTIEKLSKNVFHATNDLKRKSKVFYECPLRKNEELLQKPSVTVTQEERYISINRINTR